MYLVNQCNKILFVKTHTPSIGDDHRHESPSLPLSTHIVGGGRGKGLVGSGVKYCTISFNSGSTVIRDTTTEILVSVTTQFGCDKPPEACDRPEKLPYLDENLGQLEFSP